MAWKRRSTAGRVLGIWLAGEALEA
jgi:hypothetical protein